MSSLADPAFLGVLQAIDQARQDGPLQEEIDEDIESEQQTLPAVSFKELQIAVQEASKGVSEGTDGEYRRLLKDCNSFLRHNNLIKDTEDFFSSTPSPHAPEMIVAWIMDKCDTINIDGTPKPHTQDRAGFTYGQKMRAATTYGFGRLNGLGDLVWHKSEISNKMVGNPSISTLVTMYMYSLQKRKVQSGETPSSARAVTAHNMEDMYHKNHLPENWTIKPYKPQKRGTKDLHSWGGGRARRLLHAAMSIAFLCLLRIDEVLKIQMQDITFVNPKCIKIMLPFRKTSQNGDVKPFYLWEFKEEEAHLCPIRALAEWLDVSNIEHGYIFRKIVSGDRVSAEDEPMLPHQFLEMFRNALLDIGVDSLPYGTHSFRRGGCQWLHCVRKWILRRICEWGGWSAEFTHLTIVKYLISWCDDPRERREDFLNPDREPEVKCFICGRSCFCGF